jgi:hypothetical protein
VVRFAGWCRLGSVLERSDHLLHPFAVRCDQLSRQAVAETQIVRPLRRIIGLSLDVCEFVVELAEPAKEPTQALDLACCSPVRSAANSHSAGSLCRRGK